MQNYFPNCPNPNHPCRKTTFLLGTGVRRESSPNLPTSAFNLIRRFEQVLTSLNNECGVLSGQHGGFSRVHSGRRVPRLWSLVCEFQSGFHWSYGRCPAVLNLDMHLTHEIDLGWITRSSLKSRAFFPNEGFFHPRVKINPGEN